MTNRTGPARPWPADEFSRVDLHVDDPPADETGPVPAATPIVGHSDNIGYKIVGATGAVVAAMAGLDKALEGTGVTAADVAARTGPALGAVYQNYPVVVLLLLVAWALMRSYRRDQDASRRRDRRLQAALSNLTRGFGDLSARVADFTDQLGQVKDHVERRVTDAVGAAARAATDRADRADGAIGELRRVQAEHGVAIVALGERVTKIEGPERDAPQQPRRTPRGGKR